MTEEVKRMLDYIYRDTEISPFEIEKLFHKSYERFFTKITGFYADHSAIYGINSRHFKMDYNTNIEMNVEKFHKLLENKGISLEEFELYYHNCILAGKIYGNRETGFTISRNTVDNLVFFLRHIANGKADESLKETHEYMKENGLKYDDEKFKFKIGTCTVERFKNGNLKITYETTKVNHEKVIDKILRLQEINQLLS